MWRPWVEVEGIILEAPDTTLVAIVKDCLVNGKGNHLFPQGMKRVKVPEDATQRGVPAKAYDAYRLGLVSACADAVCVREIDGELQVPLLARANPPFQGGWWVQGGAIFNFRLITKFLLWKVLKEAGQRDGDIHGFLSEEHPLGPLWWHEDAHVIPAPLGVYRTAAEDSAPGTACDTLNVAYIVLWSAERPFGHDKDHTALRWVTLPELEADPNLCGHWYPQHLATRALQIVSRAKEEIAE